jgi:predicted adenine nucleotide alpha hydrolase (AANH) superfamily ATPase
VLERLAADFTVTIYYYNPNMSDKVEFQRRADELAKLRGLGADFEVVVEEYAPAEYDEVVAGYEMLGEGSERCYRCYELRMSRAAKYAAQGGFDYFATTLSVSPHKKSDWIREIGLRHEALSGVRYLDRDFKKQDGYRRSLELSRELGLYRQNYCGCKWSKAESAERAKARGNSRA